MKKVFFSYCQKDQASFEFIKRFIKETDYFKREDSYFWDKEKNDFGDDYWKNIYNAIQTTDVFVFFNSNNYFWSASCCKELVWAKQLEKNEKLKIIEIRVEDDVQIKYFPASKIYALINDDQLVNKLFRAIEKGEFTGFESEKLIDPSSSTLEIKDGMVNFNLKFLKSFNSLLILIFSEKNDEDHNLQNLDFEFSDISNNLPHSGPAHHPVYNQGIYINYPNAKIYLEQNYHISFKAYEGIRIFIHDPYLGPFNLESTYTELRWN